MICGSKVRAISKTVLMPQQVWYCIRQEEEMAPGEASRIPGTAGPLASSRTLKAMYPNRLFGNLYAHPVSILRTCGSFTMVPPSFRVVQPQDCAQTQSQTSASNLYPNFSVTYRGWSHKIFCPNPHQSLFDTALSETNGSNVASYRMRRCGKLATLCHSSVCSHSVAMLVCKNTPANFTNGIGGSQWALKAFAASGCSKRTDAHLAVLVGNQEDGAYAPQSRLNDEHAEASSTPVAR